MNTLSTSALSRLAVLLTAFVAGCSTGDGEAARKPADAKPAPNVPTAVVRETMDAGTYTYVELAVDGAPMWFAGPQTPLAKGDTLVVPSRELPMQNFKSDTLGRTFDVVYFVQSFQKIGSETVDVTRTMQAAHGAAAVTPTPGIDLAGIAKADGGQTVAELFALGKAAAGTDVAVRGRVVKYNGGILGKNWLHVRDGSGADGTNDITITSTDEAAVGDTVLVRGKLAADRDLGMGYKFELLIEDARVTVE